MAITATRRKVSVVLAAAALLLGMRPAGACSVPVFRYALERWPADMYRLVLFHRGPLSEGQQADVEKIKALQESEYGLPPLGVFPIDVEGEIPEQLAPLWEKEREAALPRAVLMYPAMTMPKGVAWAGSLPEAARVVVELSPVRRELAKRLIDGQTAVWLLVEKGDAAKDAQAEKVLTETLKEMKQELRLPHQIDPADAEYDMALEEGVELKIEFSFMRFAPDDPKEMLLVSILRGLLGEEMDESLPMAIPVFGRGRALAVIPQEQLTDETIADVCFFLVGPCSCQVKAQNPGFDILLPVNWDGLIMGMIGADEALPPLTVPVVARPEETAAQAEAGKSQGGAAPAGAQDDSVLTDEASVSDARAMPGEEKAVDELPSAAPAAADVTADDAGEAVASAPLTRNLIAIGAVALAGLAVATVLVLRKGRGAGAPKA
ncbi:MAG: hypothetical protein ACYTKD_08975 [Planctomycetota bacterium]